LARTDGRSNSELRPTTITLGAQAYAEGSVMIETGMTRVLCAVSVENSVPPFLRGSGKGWVTSEYAMLPRATHTRSQRETRPRGRTQEIQRLIGRSLRAVVDMDKLGERTLTVDCDVIQADGGTRTASITGAYVALYQAFHTLVQHDELDQIPLIAAVAATSVGIAEGDVLLDLCYEEDSQAGGDFNIVMTDKGEFVEVQGTAEKKTFTRDQLDLVLSAAGEGINQLFNLQRKVISGL
jgi:ribonuclease PH